MDNVDIINESLAQSQIEELAQIANQIKAIADQLGQCESRISSAWGSDTADKESYLSGIGKSIENLTSYTGAIGKVQGYLNTHLQRQKTNASKSAN